MIHVFGRLWGKKCPVPSPSTMLRIKKEGVIYIIRSYPKGHTSTVGFDTSFTPFGTTQLSDQQKNCNASHPLCPVGHLPQIPNTWDLGEKKLHFFTYHASLINGDDAHRRYFFPPKMGAGRRIYHRSWRSRRR